MIDNFDSFYLSVGQIDTLIMKWLYTRILVLLDLSAAHVYLACSFLFDWGQLLKKCPILIDTRPF
jgi:hypothetical protein